MEADSGPAGGHAPTKDEKEGWIDTARLSDSLKASGSINLA